MPVGLFVPAAAADLALSFASDVDAASHGAVLFRNSDSRWHALAPGTAGQVLTSGGAGADPTWAAAGGGGVTDHGALTGLGDDDHAGYIWNAPAASARNVVQPAGNFIGLIVRGHATQAENLQQWQNSSSQVLARITAGGFLDLRDSAGNVRIITDSGSEGPSLGIGVTPNAVAKLHIENTTAGNQRAPAWLISGTGVNAHSQMVFGEGVSGSTHAQFVRHSNASANAGWFQIINQSKPVSLGVTSNPITLYISSGGLVNINGTTGTAHLTTHCTSATRVGTIVKGFAAQSANLEEWQDSAGGILSTISENGYWMTRKTAAPADAELSNSEVALWLDATPGATLLRIKAKDSAGTVRTGSVALA